MLTSRAELGPHLLYPKFWNAPAHPQTWASPFTLHPERRPRLTLLSVAQPWRGVVVGQEQEVTT